MHGFARFSVIGLCAVFWALLPFGALGQLNRPAVRMFRTEITGINSRIFSLTEDKDGVLLAAATDIHGLAIFDGSRWKILDLKKACFSLACSDSGTIWLCLDDEIGYLLKDSFGNYSYRQFQPKELEGKSYFFDCSKTDNGVRFASSRMICDIDETQTPFKIQIHSTTSDERMIGWDQPELWIKNVNSGDLYRVDVDGSRELFNAGYNAKDVDYVFKLRQNGPSLFIRDNWRTIYQRIEGQWQIFSEELEHKLGKGELLWVLPMSDGRLGCGTTVGFICINREGAVDYQINAVDGIVMDRVGRWGELSNNRLWLTSDAGIAVLTNSSGRSERKIFPLSTIPVYDLEHFRGKTYVASNRGTVVVSDQSPNPNDSLAKSVEGVRTLRIYRDKNDLYSVGSSGVTRLTNVNQRVFKKMASRIVRVSPDRILIGTQGPNYFVLDTTESEEWKPVQSLTLPGAQPKLMVQENVVWFSGLNGEVKVLDFKKGWDAPPVSVEIESDVDFDWARACGMVNGQFLVATDAGILVAELEPKRVALKSDPKFDDLNKTFRNFEGYSIVDCGKRGLIVQGETTAGLHRLVDGK